MPLQSSGQISISDITNEIPTLIGDVSLYTLSTGNINIHSPSKPDGSAPHAMSEFFGYDHSYNPGTLIPGSDVVKATKFYWGDLCYSPMPLVYTINTPKVMIGTLVKNSNGTSISSTKLPGYLYYGSGYVAQIETNGIVSLLNNCETVGGEDPVGPIDGGGDDDGPVLGEPGRDDPFIGR